MADITTETIKQLRDATGVSVMQCKKALEEAGGDMEKAIMILRKMSGAQAAKKADRTLGSGTVESYIHANKKVGVLLEIQCETDFVAQNSDFQQLAKDIALHIAGMGPTYVAPEHIPADEKEKAAAFFKEEITKSGKPTDIQEKMLQGKLVDFFKEKTLLDQPFVKNPDITIKGLIDQTIQKTGEKIEVARFVRYTIL